jgi:hypothetical protein
LTRVETFNLFNTFNWGSPTLSRAAPISMRDGRLRTASRHMPALIPVFR